MNSDLLEHLISKLSGPLRLFAAQWTESADDVVQEAFVDLVALSRPPERPSAWLYRAVRNRAVSAQRSARRRKDRERKAISGRAVWFESTAGDRIDAQRCIQLLKQLNRVDRAIVVAKIWSDLTFEEIGNACGVSASTACRRYSRALDQLRSLIEPSQTTS